VLHDGAGQLIFALRLALADLRRDVDSTVAPRIDELIQLTDELDRQLWCAEEELRPAVLDQGLVPAIQQVCDRVARVTGLSVTFAHGHVGRLSLEVEASVYRAMHEALMNVVRHARATAITVTLERRPELLACTVRDDGIGLPASSPALRGPGLGLTGIQARLADVGGSVELSSSPGRGTDVSIAVPLPKELAHAC
jgi:signal transduction histidine kinase